MDVEDDEPKILMRHDIDISIRSAYELAHVEADLGIRTTYFVQIRSPLYNLLSSVSLNMLEKIVALGHEVGLHAEISHPISDMRQNIINDVKMFCTMFPQGVPNIVSFHRVGNKIDDLAQLDLGEIRHTYEANYTKKIGYYSDSQGYWRFGHPLLSSYFDDRNDLHVLTHPEWWIAEGKSVGSKIVNLVEMQDAHFVEMMQNHVFSQDITHYFLSGDNNE